MKRRLAAALPIAVLFGVILAAEGALRLSRGAPPAEPLPENFRYAHLDVQSPFFEPDPDQPGGMRAGRPGAPQGRFTLRKPPGTFRVFVIGGSVAFPLVGGAAEEIWKRTLPGVRAEVIRAAMSAYDSRRDLSTLRETLAYNPDLLVVLSGNNEFLDNSISSPRLYLLNRRLRRFWLWRGLQGAGARPRPSRFSVEGAFESNLREMARAARAAGVPIVFCTLPADLWDIAPEPARPAADALVASARDAWRRGDVIAAAALWRQAAGRDPNDAESTFYLGLSLLRLGRSGEAREKLRAAADLGGIIESRCPPARNERIRRIAREEGAVVADIERLLDALHESGVEPLMYDHCHWASEYYPLVALEIVSSLAKAGVAADRWDLSWAAAARPRLSRPVISASRRRVYAARCLRAALDMARRTPPMSISQRILSMMILARRLSPDAWREFALSPQAVQKLFTEPFPGSGDLMKGGLERGGPPAWETVAAYLREMRDRRYSL